jgi:hypothetical protein
MLACLRAVELNTGSGGSGQEVRVNQGEDILEFVKRSKQGAVQNVVAEERERTVACGGSNHHYFHFYFLR